jgi:hypothetical protein
MRDALLESATYDRILCPVPDDHLSGFLTGFEESPGSRLASARAKTGMSRSHAVPPSVVGKILILNDTRARRTLRRMLALTSMCQHGRYSLVSSDVTFG